LVAEVPFFLPLVKRTHTYRGWQTASRTPLFPGYVFMRGTDEDRVKCLATNRLARVLASAAQDELAAELRHLKRLIDSDAPLTVERRLAAGQRVRVRNGPLEGLEGTVLSRRTKTHLVVAVSFTQGASIEIGDWLVEPV
jgi:transcription antitermination factor NusG